MAIGDRSTVSGGEMDQKHGVSKRTHFRIKEINKQKRKTNGRRIDVNLFTVSAGNRFWASRLRQGAGTCAPIWSTSSTGKYRDSSRPCDELHSRSSFREVRYIHKCSSTEGRPNVINGQIRRF